ncbi:MAG: type I pullulanase [Muribaculaceae bacterium]|nr:type I pullulanase [Muribaculaceae bacterium]
MVMKKLMACAIALSMALPMAAHSTEFNEMIYNRESTSFMLNTLDDAQAVTVRIYNQGAGGKAVKTLNLKRDKLRHGEWQGTVKGDMNGKFYTFDVKYKGKWQGENAGTFARAVGINGQRGAILDLASTNPAGWEKDCRPSIEPKDLVIYEMHHRDFSIDPSGEFVNRGKFLALSEPRAIAHLKALGVNAVHILPSFDFASIDESRPELNKYNWGYDPLNYNVPEGSYSTNAADPACRIREFKTMVKALHDAGIKVILDVVYNHTYSIEGSNFQKTMPDAYFRKNADGTYSNGSGCGNETASEGILRLYMLESVKYWMEEYHIDGFRFDLMGVHDIETMNCVKDVVRSIDPQAFVYGEGWSAGSCAYPYEKLAMKAHVKQLPEIAAFSDDIRDALRGPFSDDTKPAFLAALPGNEESIKFGIVGAIAHPQVDMTKVNYSKEPFALEPTQMIAYVSCHDDMCLVDRLKASIPGIGLDELIRLDLLAQTAVFTSQGVPFMLSGEEMLRDKKGVHNSFESPDSINHLDWTNLERYPQVFNYYKGLIALRKNHGGFRLGNAELVREHLEFLPADDCVVAFRLKDLDGFDTWSNIVVVLNANNHAIEVAVPEGDYTVVCRNILIDENGIDRVSGSKLTVPAQSALIVHN